MKYSRITLLGTSVALVLSYALPVHAAPVSSAEEWLNHYYQNPQPEQFVPALFELSRSGYFEQPGHVPLAIGFIAGVFEQNAEQIDQWLMYCRALPPAHQRLVASALWYSGHPKGANYLRAYARMVSPEMRGEIERLLASEPALRETGVLSGSSMNLQWGAFLATGDSQHILNLLTALGSGEPGLSTAARLALAEKAATHPRVYEICQAQLARQPVNVRDQMRAALTEVNVRH
jgi:hypothetical protein